MRRTTRKTRAVAVLGTVALVGSLATACGSSGGSNSSSTGGTSSSGSAKAKGGQTITYWTSQQGTTCPATVKTLDPVVKKFEQQSGDKVNVKCVGWANLQKNLLSAVSSNNPPDVVNIGNTWAPQMQATGAFVDFDAKNLKAVGGKSKFVASSFKTTGAKGKTPSSLPLYALSYGMFYNKKMFKAAGISSPPKTWSEFVKDAKKLTKPDKGQYGVAVENNFTENSHFAFLLGQQLGAKLFDASGKPTFTSDAEVNAVQKYVELMGKSKVVNPSDAQNSNDSSAAINAFANGKAAMVINQNNGVLNIQAAKKLKSSDWGTAEMPVLDGGKQVLTFPAGINVAVYKKTKHLDASLAFVKFLTDKPAQITLNKAFTSIPVNVEAGKDKAFSTPTMTPFKNALQHAVPLPRIPQEGDFETQVGNALIPLFQKAAQGKMPSKSDIKSALKTAQTKVAQAAS